jgi:hypothetical protein
MNLFLILIGIGLILGAFYSTWLMLKIIEDIEKKKKTSKNK